MDAPFYSLEPTARKQMRAAFPALQRELGVAVVVATRGPLDAFGIADRVVMIKAGSVQQTATPSYAYLQDADKSWRTKRPLDARFQTSAGPEAMSGP
jgi:iron(III) transport system ATP-binding protein